MLRVSTSAHPPEEAHSTCTVPVLPPRHPCLCCYCSWCSYHHCDSPTATIVMMLLLYSHIVTWGRSVLSWNHFRLSVYTGETRSGVCMWGGGGLCIQRVSIVLTGGTALRARKKTKQKHCCIISRDGQARFSENRAHPNFGDKNWSEYYLRHYPRTKWSKTRKISTTDLTSFRSCYKWRHADPAPFHREKIEERRKH